MLNRINSSHKTSRLLEGVLAPPTHPHHDDDDDDDDVDGDDDDDDDDDGGDDFEALTQFWQSLPNRSSSSWKVGSPRRCISSSGSVADQNMLFGIYEI